MRNFANCAADYESYICYNKFFFEPYYVLMGVGAGALFCLGFNLKANSLMKQASQMQSYSLTFIENEIMQFGDNKLTAGINVMGNRIVNSHCLGLTLGLNF